MLRALLRKMPAWVFGLLLVLWLPMAITGVLLSLEDLRAFQAGRALPAPPAVPASAFDGASSGPVHEVAISQLVPVGEGVRRVETAGPDTLYRVFLSGDARVAVAAYSVTQRQEAIDPSMFDRATDGSVTLRGFLKTPSGRAPLYAAIQTELAAGGLGDVDIWLVDPFVAAREDAFAHEIGGIWFRMGVILLISLILAGLFWRARRRRRQHPRAIKGPWGAVPAPKTTPRPGRTKPARRDPFHDSPIQSRKGWFR